MEHIEKESIRVAERFNQATQITSHLSSIKNNLKNSPRTDAAHGDIAIHMDGVVSFYGHRSAAGVIARDANGLAIQCRNIRFGFLSNLVIELQAILHGMLLAMENGWATTTIYSDSKLAVDIISS